MAYALELAFDIPPAWGYLLCALVVIPLVTHGVTAISALQVWTQPLWLLLLPSAVLGVGMAGIWAPLASTVTRNLPTSQAGAGSGVYNTTRQIGSVLGSAAIAALMNARLALELPGFDTESAQRAGADVAGPLPPEVGDGFAAAMSESLWLALGAYVICAVVVLCFAKPKVTVAWGETGAGERTAPLPAPSQ